MIGKSIRLGMPDKLALGMVALAAAALPAAGALATAEDPTAKLSAEDVEKGRQIFTDWSCGACHALADAQSTGGVGPGLDGNANLDHALIVDRITNGAGPMPSFGGQIPDEEIDLVSRYIMQAKK